MGGPPASRLGFMITPHHKKHHVTKDFTWPRTRTNLLVRLKFKIKVDDG